MERWNGWGDPARATELSEPVLELLRPALGIADPPPAPAAAADVRLPDPALTPAALDRLAAVVGSAQVRTEPIERIRHTRGKSTVDLLRMRSGDGSDAPDAVVRPASHDEVVEVLAACGAERIAVVPFGGGTSVVGGLAVARNGFAGVIALDLGRLTGVTVDPVSLLATVDAGLTGPALEAELVHHGLTLGHYPQSFEYATIGGYAATRSAGQFSLGYGRFDELVMALRIATPSGTIDVGRAPRSAAGPDLRQLFLGSEGTLGVITSVTLQVQRAPERTELDAWSLPDFRAGLDAARALVQSGLRPTMVRISDEHETGINALVEGRPAAPGCLTIVGYEHAAAGRDRSAIAALLRDRGAQSIDEAAVAGWQHARFRAPYLRDALLDAGALVETVETAGFWSRLPGLYDQVRACLAQAAPLVLCHLSHAYPTGAALYFTVACAQSADPVTQWQETKAAVNRAIVAAGGTITHHHAVGRDHALVDEIGPLGVATLRAVKERLDPAGIMNPGILLPPL